MTKRTTWTGRFDEMHTATLDFNLHSASDGAQYRTTGIIDTGFTGFIQIPMSAGIQLDLVAEPLTFSKITLANGELQDVILKSTNVTVDQDTRAGVCVIPLAEDSLTLVGMDFLRRFERILIVSYKNGIHLASEDLLKSV